MGNIQVDSHQHFWQINRGDYRWLTADLDVLYRDFLPADIAPLLAENGIHKTVLVQAADSEAETDFMLSLAEQYDFIAGVVGWVDMASPDAANRIHELAKNPFFKGIRPMIQDINDPNWMLMAQLNEAFVALQENNLSFDALVLPHHLPNLLKLLKRHPELRTVIDHGAKPNIAAGNNTQWFNDLEDIAGHTHAFCKVSGLVTEAGENANADTLQPYFDHLYNCFGPNRLLWGSDWPVVNLSMNYGHWRILTNTLFSALSDSDKQRILGDNACEFYQLQD
ncbi:amidohydrolase family protein [Porticoccus sp. W117]|uniref:amidohydrolase family protein n=1 Tax=Porticoccus sp. W117 TaxID=3054777 RepID=UPI0025929224|nr:amidohydrolase family protein [Porticoccus sp. W117]MDM3872119.1 amidohydrolase family protein [Porticoccus sp. W117]